MRIAIFTDTFYPQINGVSKTVDRFINYLKNSEHEYFLITPRYEHGVKFSDNRMHCRNVKVVFNKDLRFAFISKKRLISTLDKFSPDIIHVMSEFPIGRAGIAYARKRNLPLVTSFETNIPEYFEYYHLKALTGVGWKYYKNLHQYSDMILTPSNDSKELLLGQGFENVEVWERGIEVNRFSPEFKDMDIRRKYASDDAFLITYVGRIGREKDLPVWIEAARRLKEKYGEKVAFCIVGDGPYMDTLKSIAPPYINMTGFLVGDELLRVYASSDIFLFTSSTETLGFVILEAMASGLPVVSCYEGGIKDTLIDGYNGIACRKNSVDELVDGVSKLIEDEQLRKTMALNARAYAETKDWDRTFAQLVNMLQKVIDRGNKHKKKFMRRRDKAMKRLEDFLKKYEY